jgi:hypothetical protein
MSRFLATIPDLPEGAPPEVLAQIEVAWKRARVLFDSDLALHFEIDAEQGRAWAELLRPDGSVAEHFSAVEALEIGCGEGSPDFISAA